MKIRYPRASVAILAAALLAGTSVVTAYAVTESAAPSADTAATENGSTWWKAEISEDDTGVASDTISGWYTQVYEPTYAE